jgi:hypothetical protein
MQNAVKKMWFFSLHLIFFYCTEGALWHLPKFLQCLIVKFTASIILLYPPFPDSWNSFIRSHFSIFINEYRIFPPYSPPTPFPYILPPHWCQTPDRTCFPYLLSVFEKRPFCLYKIAIQGVSLWHFHVYMYCNLNWFTPSIFLLSTLVPLVRWFQQT